MRLGPSRERERRLRLAVAHAPGSDPARRNGWVHLPREYEREPRRRFPVFVDIVGFMGSGAAHLNWKPFGDNVPERAARLIAGSRMGPAIFVFPDCFTSLGGNQYVNSTAIGAYADYLTKELGDREFFVGNALSIADIAVATMLVNLEHAGETVDGARWPKLADFAKRMHARPSFKSCIQEEQNFMQRLRAA